MLRNLRACFGLLIACSTLTGCLLQDEDLLPETASASATDAMSKGTATLTWNAPVQYTDGTSLPMSDLSAFRIYHGTSAGSLSSIAEVDNRTTAFTVQNLGAGTHYFVVTAISLQGTESAFSDVRSKTVL